MKISIRAGPDQLSRSLALAQALAELEPSSEITLLTSGCPETREGGIRQLNIGAAGLPPAWDLDATEEAIERADILVLDNAPDEKFQKALRRKAGLLVVVEDHPHGGAYAADCIVNPNVNAHIFEYAGSGAETLLGTEFFALPRAFDEFQDFRPEVPEKCRKIALHLGQDRKGASVSLVRKLKKARGGFIATICILPDSPNGQALASEIGLDSRFIVAGADPRRMAQAEVAVGSESTFNELLLFRVPTLLPPGSPLSDYAAKAGMCAILSEDRPEDDILSLMADKGPRERMSARMSELGDGLGRYRLAEELLKMHGGK